MHSDGIVLARYIEAKFEESDLSIADKTKLHIAMKHVGDYHPENLEVELLDIDIAFAEGKISELLSILRSLPKPKTSTSEVIFTDGIGKTFSFLEMCAINHSVIYSFEDFSQDWEAHLDKIKEEYTITSSTLNLDEPWIGPLTLRDKLVVFTTQYGRLKHGAYIIDDKEGTEVEFKLNEQQEFVYKYQVAVHPRIILLKSRQTGASTMFLMKAFDEALTQTNQTKGLMAQGKKEASNLSERIKKAWKRLKYASLFETSLIKDNSEKIEFSNGCELQVAVSFRSGTLQSLHVSELGKIASASPTKAEELVTGTLQAIKAGLPIALESTAEGMDNMFHDKWQISMETLQSGRKLSPKDFYPVFLSCWDDSNCELSLEDGGITEEEILQAIAEDQKIQLFFGSASTRFESELGRKLNGNGELKIVQINWWLAQFREFGYKWEQMLQEYPDVPTAAFSASKDGSYYSNIIYKDIIGKSRDHISYERSLPVYAAFDLGMADAMVCTYFQVHRNELRVIDCYYNESEGIAHYINQMRSTGYNVDRVYLPHDASIRELSTNRSRAQEFRSQGVTVIQLARTKSVVEDIEQIRQVLVKYTWFAGKASHLLKQLAKYKKEYDVKREVFKDKPLHDASSDFADSFRYAALAAIKYHRLGRYDPTNRKSKFKSNIVDGMAM